MQVIVSFSVLSAAALATFGSLLRSHWRRFSSLALRESCSLQPSARSAQLLTEESEASRRHSGGIQSSAEPNAVAASARGAREAHSATTACSGAKLARPPGQLHSSTTAATAVRRPRDRLKMMMSRLALRGASRVPTRSMTTTKTVDDAAMRERERCWAAWANADTLHLCVGSVPSGLVCSTAWGRSPSLTRIHAGTICVTRC